MLLRKQITSLLVKAYDDILFMTFRQNNNSRQINLIF